MVSSDLYELEAQLDERERMCLAGYLLIKDSDDKAMIKAFVYSRSYPVKEEMSVIRKKAEKWFSSGKVQAFLELWKGRGEFVTEQNRREVVSKRIDTEENALTATEDIIQRYEQLYQEAQDIEDKAKILKMIVDTRHKNRDEVKEEGNVAEIYLPLRCIECPLYLKEKERIL